MLNILYGNTGTGKSYAMMDMIKAAAEKGSVCVIVPDQFTFEYEKALCGHMGCRLFNKGNTDVWSFSRLVRDIFAVTGAPEEDAADQTAKTAVLYRTIKDAAGKNQLAFFAAQSKKQSFTGTVMTMLGELIHSRVSPEMLGEIISKSGTSENKLSDLLTLYTGYTERLSGSGLRDSLFDMQLAVRKAADKGYFKDRYIFMDEFKSFTGDQYEMIRTMLSDCTELTVCITADSMASPGGNPFVSSEETCGHLINAAKELGIPHKKTVFAENRRHKGCLSGIAEGLVRKDKLPFEGDAECVSVVTAPTLYDECSYICAEIRRLTSECGYRYGEIAVLGRKMNEDISVLAAHFDRYRIPFYSDRKLPVGHKPPFMMIISALELASAKEFSTEALLRYLKTGLTDIDEESISRLENFCYEWDIDGDMWLRTFPEDSDGKEDMPSLDDIRRNAIAPILKLKEDCSGKNGRQICAALREFIRESDIEEKLPSAVSGSITDAANAELARENERLCQALDTIVSGLERAFEKDTDTVSMSDFCEIFKLCAAGISLAAPPQELDCVTAQQSDLARLSRPKVVFVMHANDGIFPFIPEASRTFTEAERELFRKAGRDLSGSMRKRLSDEKFNAFKAVCAPSERLYISYSETDIDGKGIYPSEYIGKITALYPNCRRIHTDRLGLLFYCRTPEAAYTAAVERWQKKDSGFEEVRRELEKYDEFRHNFEYLDSLSSGLNAGHKIGDTSLMERLYGKKGFNISASRFEDYSICPFRYFCKTGLKLKKRMKNGLTAINWGNAVHAALSDILGKFDKEHFLKLDEKALNREVIRSVRKYVREEMNGSFGKPPSFPVYLRIMRENIVKYLLTLQKELQLSDFRPDAFELKIGNDSQNKASVSDGTHTLSFFGTTDRVDVCERDGKKYIRIVDYKTGAKKYSRDQLEHGINMQMFLYLFSLMSGSYKGYLPAGVLYAPVRTDPLRDARSAEKEDIEENIQKSLKMFGEILKDKDIINAMEKADENGDRHFIPVDTDENGEPEGEFLLSEDGFEYIKQLSEKQLEDMCRSVYEGELPASPLKSESMTPQCALCDFREICANTRGIEERPRKKASFGSEGAKPADEPKKKTAKKKEE
ncbi:MAG: PD-(D/E)XK nuclease family protein [Huintestinicola sp.]